MSVSQTVSTLLLLSAVFGTAATSGQSPASPDQTAAPVPAACPPIPEIPYEKFVLKNGLTVLVHEDHKAPIVAVNVWYHVGSKNEKPGKTGFAHLFEHLMFNGSENFNDDYFKAVEPHRRDRPQRHDQRGPHELLPERARSRRSTGCCGSSPTAWAISLGVIDKARLDEQRGVVQNEKRQGENEPYGKTCITVAENTYPKGHPYSWTVIGSMEDLNARRSTT